MDPRPPSVSPRARGSAADHGWRDIAAAVGYVLLIIAIALLLR